MLEGLGGRAETAGVSSSPTQIPIRPIRPNLTRWGEAAPLTRRATRGQVAINALYALMHRCKVEAEGRSGEGAGRWRRRQETVLYTLLTHHLQASDFNVVLQWLERLLDAHPTDLVRRRGCGEGRGCLCVLWRRSSRARVVCAGEGDSCRVRREVEQRSLSATEPHPAAWGEALGT